MSMIGTVWVGLLWEIGDEFAAEIDGRVEFNVICGN